MDVCMLRAAYGVVCDLRWPFPLYCGVIVANTHKLHQQFRYAIVQYCTVLSLRVGWSKRNPILFLVMHFLHADCFGVQHNCDDDNFAELRNTALLLRLFGVCNLIWMHDKYILCMPRVWCERNSLACSERSKHAKLSSQITTCASSAAYNEWNIMTVCMCVCTFWNEAE